ncbi:GPP34 family phosphoprotein [Nocardia sp. 2YAB30]|uniref:GOLPH3/VPS74 family protein n=1 Tax=Nocardia sp. 2YAB30 TaxID=3233022 RepID=UPI003F9C6CEB
MTLLAEDLLWLLLDDQTGHPLVDHISMSCVLSGAVLLNLTRTTSGSPRPPLQLTHRGQTPKPSHLTLTATLTTADHDEVSAIVADLLRRRPRTPTQAIEHLRRPVHRILLHRLCADGRVAATTSRLFGLIPLRSWPTLDHPRKAALRQPLHHTLLDARPPNPRTTDLIALLDAVDALPAQCPGWNPHTITRFAHRVIADHHRWSIDAVHAAIHTSYADSFTTLP